MLLSLMGGYSVKVKCSMIYLSFMNPALIKTIKLLMMSLFLPVNDDHLSANSSNANKG